MMLSHILYWWAITRAHWPTWPATMAFDLNTGKDYGPSLMLLGGRWTPGRAQQERLLISCPTLAKGLFGAHLMWHGYENKAEGW